MIDIFIRSRENALKLKVQTFIWSKASCGPTTDMPEPIHHGSVDGPSSACLPSLSAWRTEQGRSLQRETDGNMHCLPWQDWTEEIPLCVASYHYHFSPPRADPVGSVQSFFWIFRIIIWPNILESEKYTNHVFFFTVMLNYKKQKYMI